MDLSIVILNYNDAGLLKNCLKSVFKHNYGLNYEVIVVDNNSADQTRQVISDNYQNKLNFIALNKNTGHSFGNNVGIKAAHGRYVLILNPDIVVFDNSLVKMVKFMDANPDIGICGAKLLNPDRTIQHNCRRHYKFLTPFYTRTVLGRTRRGQNHLNYFYMKDFDYQSVRQVDWLFGACLMVRKSAISLVGLFDQRFFLYFSDVDWCRRFKQNNYKVCYFPETALIHYYHRQSASNNLLKSFLNPATRIHIIDWLKYLIKYYGK